MKLTYALPLTHDIKTIDTKFIQNINCQQQCNEKLC